MSRATSAFDVIVVGAGSAGIGVCYNLALKYPSIRILLLERGSSASAPLASRSPLLSHYGSWFSKKLQPFQRTYTTAKEDALGGRSLPITRGMGFGGSSLLDDMSYLRGTQADVASWGSSSWTWEALSDTLRKVQRNSRDSRLAHGELGPLSITDASCALTNSNLNLRFFQACEAAGMPSSVDFNDGVCDGQGSAQSFIHRGARVDMFDALIMENKHRTKNLDVRSQQSVAKVLFNKEGGTCVGVVLDNGEELRGDKVILCAGALETPALLLRSGVGSAESLRASGVTPVVHVDGVGDNLIAQPTLDLTFRLDNKFHGITRSRTFQLTNLPYMYKQWKEYLDEGSGVFSSSHEASAFVRSEDGTPTANLGIQFIPAPLLQRGEKWANFPGYTTRLTLHRPQSRGSVKLDNMGRTVITSGMLREAADVKALDEGIMWVGLLCGPGSTLQSGYHQMPTTDLRFDAPFNGIFPILAQPTKTIGTPQAAEAHVRSASYIGQSLFGSCAMGTVVDDGLRVKGTGGTLLVADSSVVPTTTLGNSRTWNLAIGLRCAEIL